MWCKNAVNSARRAASAATSVYMPTSLLRKYVSSWLRSFLGPNTPTGMGEGESGNGNIFKSCDSKLMSVQDCRKCWDVRCAKDNKKVPACCAVFRRGPTIIEGSKPFHTCNPSTKYGGGAIANVHYDQIKMKTWHGHGRICPQLGHLFIIVM